MRRTSCLISSLRPIAAGDDGRVWTISPQASLPIPQPLLGSAHYDSNCVSI